MIKPIHVYNMGEEGVNVDVDDVHLRDGELRSAQNMQIDPAGGIGGVRRRDGMSPYSSGISGSLTGMIGIPLPDRSQLTRRFYAPMDDDDAGRWRTSTDGTSWSDTGANGIEMPRQISDFAGLAAGSLNLILGAAPGACALNNKLYYFGSDYVQGTDLPTIHVWDGTTDYQIGEIPINPSVPADIPETGVSITPYDDRYLIVTCWDNTGGRVFTLDTSNGAMAQLGPETVLPSAPFAVAIYQGAIWIGLVNGSGGSATTVRYCRPGDATWTTDLTTGTALGYCVSLLVFKGKLYAGFAADVGTAGVIKQRTSDGVWSDVHTQSGATDPINYAAPMLLSSDGLTAFGVEADVSGNIEVLKTTDGATWTSDEDIAALLTSSYSSTGRPYLDSNGDIYWIFRTTGNADKLLKRTAAGAWSVVDTDSLTGQVVAIKI